MKRKNVDPIVFAVVNVARACGVADTIFLMDQSSSLPIGIDRKHFPILSTCSDGFWDHNVGIDYQLGLKKDC